MLILVAHAVLVDGKRKQMLCAACHVVVYEIEHEISKVDPHKVLEIEGFRVDPTGNQKSKKVKYARSETHLTEITEGLCDKMNEYAKSVNGETGDVSYVLTKSRDGTPLKLENVTFEAGDAEKLKHNCNSIIEDNEENIIEHFKKPHKNSKKVFCTDIAELCEDDDNDDSEEETENEEKSSNEEL